MGRPGMGAVVLFTVVAVVTAGAAAFIADAPARNTNQTNSKQLCGEELCLTSECVHTASRILSSMDLKADPCNSFYSFACGEFVRSTKIPDDKTGINTFSLIRDMVTEQLRTIYEEPITDDEFRPFRLAKQVYKACINRTEIEARGLSPIKAILKDLGGWPVLEGESWNDTEFDWKKTVHKLRSLGLGINYIIGFSVSVDAKNTTRRIIALDQASLGLSREYLLKGFEEKRVSAYHQYQKDLAAILGADPETANKDLAEVLEFETALANISMSKEERRNNSLLYNPTTIEAMQTDYPSIPWLEYINHLLPEAVRVNDSYTVNVVNPRFIAELEKLLAATEKRIQANYILWRVVKSLAYSSIQEVSHAYLKYTNKLTGLLMEKPRWKSCTEAVSDSLTLVTSSMYVKRFFKTESKHSALEMVTDIQETFRDILQNIDWMDANTKERALAKAKSMAAYIAYPDELLDDEQVDEFYKKLEVSDSDYLENMQNISRFGSEYTLSKLPEEVNKTDWKTHSRSMDVNAFYRRTENSIQFPAGILQGAFFSSFRPNYLNYGAIGSVIGHEITHGFDDKGRQTDGIGNLVDWWEPETREKFLAKAKCIIEQYSNYIEPSTGLKLNGVNNQGENIADNGGFKEAYIAYSKWSQRQNKSELRLPGLGWLTPQQMFWVAGAQVWCSTARPESIHQLITTGSHSPKQFRVDGPFSNSEHFARDFNCPLGSRMNPEHKCGVW